MQAAPIDFFKLPTGEISFSKRSAVPSLGREVASFIVSFVVFLSALWMMG
ncbi:MAG: hypothetical protein KC800_05120 [Candidatus Eremiobacteraeota bacterium]|nr:hypothetical protein [Candidatus Eremiobacteraeota bacterium]